MKLGHNCYLGRSSDLNLEGLDGWLHPAAAARLIATGGGCDRALSQTSPRLAWSGRKLKGHFNLAVYSMYEGADGLMDMVVDGSKDGDHDKESQRRSCDARLLGKGGAYAIITKPIARILELMQMRGTRCWWASLHISKRA
jgi:hypothetical protein